MIRHTSVGDTAYRQAKQLKLLLVNGSITMAGNSRLKIYGTLTCSSGKRMKAENRVFFIDECEAKAAGYRPCGHCMRGEYALWKANLIIARYEAIFDIK
jgi:methylphosphotriester-DNA--protein-cysteine methyltransferase